MGLNHHLQTEENRHRVVAVSYTNTIPFIHGLKHYPGIGELINLQLMPPADCADAWRDGKADMVLMPLGSLEECDFDKLCCSWCLGADGPVETVLLLTNTQPKEITTIFLDTESRTSALMTKMLCRFHWHIEPDFRPYNPDNPLHIKDGEAMLLIGDKTFGQAAKFPHTIDLATAWKEMTALPAVFACWLAGPSIPTQVRIAFNEALGWGVRHVEEAIRSQENLKLPYDKALKYLTGCISYHLDPPKQAAIQRFFEYRKRLA